MPLPFVIDNQDHLLADVLNALLDRSAGKPLDIATAYFSVSGYRLVRDRLCHVGAFRLLLGSEPAGGPDVGRAVDTQLSWKYDGRDPGEDRPGAVRVVVRMEVQKAAGYGA